jgi:FkbM family methyltransferase
MSFFRKIKKHYNRFMMFLDQSSNYSYAQEGEDRILMRYFDGRKKGFYLDVGAHHPRLYSNTYLFYNKGWNGINIDAMPGSMEIFNKQRPRDINIEAAISKNTEILTFYIFSDKALNTFSKDLADAREDRSKKHYLVDTKIIETKPLSDLLDKHLPQNQHIDFMTLDIEGYDLNALESINLDKYRPELILVEVYADNIMDAPIDQYLRAQGYTFYAKAVLTCIYKNSKA